MVLNGLIAVCALCGLLFLSFAVRRARRHHFGAFCIHSLCGLTFLLAAAAVGFLGVSLLTYQRLTHEQVAAEIMFSRVTDRSFRATLTYPSGERLTFDLRGDEWQIDARLLKWKGLANIAGFDTVYRLERLGGRYGDIPSERSAPRTVYALNEPRWIDAWDLARRYKDHVPGIEALFGSAAFLPMADGALFQVSVSQSGLIARPLNLAARNAVGGWR